MEVVPPCVGQDRRAYRDSRQVKFHINNSGHTIEEMIQRAERKSDKRKGESHIIPQVYLSVGGFNGVLSKPILHTVESVDEVKDSWLFSLWTTEVVKKTRLVGSCGYGEPRDQKITVMRIGSQHIIHYLLGGLGGVHDLSVGEPYNLPTLANDIILSFNEAVEIFAMAEFPKTIHL